MDEIILPTPQKIEVVESNELTTDQLSLIINLRENPVLAAKVLLGVTLEWYQAEALEDVWRKRFSIFCWSRQIGKTFLEAVLFALLCCLYPEEDAVFIAPSLRQAMNPYNYVREFYANHPVFRSMVRGKLTKTKIEFKNGSSLQPLPQGDGTKILGTHASIIGIDEYATFTEEFINTVVMPMANRKKNVLSRGNRISIISTPLSKSNHYYATFCRYKAEMAKPNSLYHVSTYTFLDSDNIDLDVLANQIKSMPWIRFARENLAEFTATAGGFFPEELLRKAQDDIEVELSGERDANGKVVAPYLLGVDPPSVNNQGGIVIMKLVEDNKKAQLVFCAGIPASEINAPELMGLIVRLVRLYDIKRIHIDQGGGGLQIADFLFQPQIIVDSYQPKVDIALPAPLSDQVVQWNGAHDIRDEMSMMNKRLEDVVIQIVPFSPLQKSALYFNFKNGLDHQDIVLPSFKMGKKYVEIEALKGEMELLQGTLTSSKLLHLDKPKDANDDRSDAAVLAYDACLAYLRQGSMPRVVEGLSHESEYRRIIGDIDVARSFDVAPRDWSDRRDW